MLGCVPETSQPTEAFCEADLAQESALGPGKCGINRPSKVLLHISARQIRVERISCARIVTTGGKSKFQPCSCALLFPKLTRILSVNSVCSKQFINCGIVECFQVTRKVRTQAAPSRLHEPRKRLALKQLVGSATTRCKSWLLAGVHGRPADTLSLEVKIYVDMVGDLDERNAFVHSVIPTVEDHFPFNLA